MSEFVDPIYRIIGCRNSDHCLAVRGDKVVFVLINPCDRYQHWTMDESTKIKDSEGQPAFALINKGSGQAIGLGPVPTTAPLLRYKSNVDFSCDESVLWTVSKREIEEGFVHIRNAGNVTIWFTANGHTIHDGHIIDLYIPNNEEKRTNMKTFLWKIEKILPKEHNISFFRTSQHTVKIHCQARKGCNLAVDKDTGTVILVPSNIKDKYQHWIKETACGVPVKDAEDQEAFALVNTATGKAIKHGFGSRYLVQLAPFNRNYIDPSLLWTESNDHNGDFRTIRMQNNTSLVFSIFDPWVVNSPLLGLWTNERGTHQQWKIEDFV